MEQDEETDIFEITCSLVLPLYHSDILPGFYAKECVLGHENKSCKGFIPCSAENTQSAREELIIQFKMIKPYFTDKDYFYPTQLKVFE